MYIYEVNLKVSPAIIDEFELWLKIHIDEMLKLPCFHKAELYSVKNETDMDILYSCHYHYNKTQDMDDYIHKYSEQMRGDGLNKFGNKFSVQRRELQKIL